MFISVARNLSEVNLWQEWSERMCCQWLMLIVCKWCSNNLETVQGRGLITLVD